MSHEAGRSASEHIVMVRNSQARAFFNKYIEMWDRLTDDQKSAFVEALDRAGVPRKLPEFARQEEM